MSVSERVKNTSEGECETGNDTVTTDDDSGSEDHDYGDTEEERNEVEDVEQEESDSPTFKVAKKKYQAALWDMMGGASHCISRL